MATRSTSSTRPPPAPDPTPTDGDAREAMLWLLGAAQAVHTLDVELNGKLFTFKYRKLLYGDTNRIAAEAWSYTPQATGGQLGVTAKFDTALFFRECVKQMFMQDDLVGQQPFPLTDKVIAAFPPELGACFDALIPNVNAALAAAVLDDQKKA